MAFDPRGPYPFGEKLLSNNGGRLFSVIVADRTARLIIVDFGVMICLVASTPEEALTQAQLFRSIVSRNWGHLRYSEIGFPIVVDIEKEKRVVFSRLPQPVEVLAANPEVFLVWADKLEAAARNLLH